MLALLATEHRFLDAMCADVRDDPGQASVLVAVLCRHLSAERQYLYPAAGSLADAILRSDDSLLSSAYALSRAKSGTDAWRQALDGLRTGVQKHVRDCEEHLFEPLSAWLSRTDLVRLGNRVDMALESAPSRPHLRAPRRTPWVKLTDPLLGAMDKVHDLFTGRRTYPPPAPEAARKRLRTRHIAITQS
jgi:hypothetical protein